MRILPAKAPSLARKSRGNDVIWSKMTSFLTKMTSFWSKIDPEPGFNLVKRRSELPFLAPAEAGVRNGHYCRLNCQTDQFIPYKWKNNTVLGPTGVGPETLLQMPCTRSEMRSQNTTNHPGHGQNTKKTPKQSKNPPFRSKPPF